MTYLLDTHIFVWLVDKARNVPQHVRERLSEPDQKLFVSSISAVEVTNKVRIGKWYSARQLSATWSEQLANVGADDVALTTEHGLLAGTLDWHHRDPFDRMLAAQAIIGDLTFVTADKVFRTLPGLDLLTW